MAGLRAIGTEFPGVSGLSLPADGGVDVDRYIEAMSDVNGWFDPQDATNKLYAMRSPAAGAARRYLRAAARRWQNQP
jgi:hypothetical protein